MTGHPLPPGRSHVAESQKLQLKEFGGMPLKAGTTKDETDTLNFKIKNFCISKNTIGKVERQPMEREMIFANHTSVKEFVPITYKKTSHLN